MSDTEWGVQLTLSLVLFCTGTVLLWGWATVPLVVGAVLFYGCAVNG